MLSPGKFCQFWFTLLLSMLAVQVPPSLKADDRVPNRQTDANAVMRQPPPDQRPGPELWSLKPMQMPQVPKLDRLDGFKNPIDQFVLEALKEHGLSPSPEADRKTLIRRVTFDLHGLPPTPEEIDAFENDPHSDAYERLVERLLAAPQYGERWGRHWLDVVRYTESQGFEYDHMRENAWQYRDYVIDSFNQDKPYDQFIREQLAGDVTEPITTDTIVATSFLVCGAWDQAGSNQANLTQRLMTREEELEDMISVVAQTFLGLTVNCARCHAHKFDPIPQADYYRLKSVLEAVHHGERLILPPVPLRAREESIAQVKARISTKEKQSTAPQDDAQRTELARSLASDKAELQKLSASPVSYVGLRKQPEPTHRLKRGDIRTPLEVVTPGGLSGLPELSSDFGLSADAPEAERRRRFAAWVVDARNPLTARVLVNRLWHFHFGQGIVATPNDFGAAGAKPSHPELLDWLAGTFRDRGWSIKSLQRLMVCSATYRQTSAYRTAAARVDADNQLLWRFAPHRLEAEAIRDAMLSVSGQLNLTAGGPSFRPFDIKSFNATFYIPKDKLGPEFNRRTVYRMNVNSGKDPLLEAFDCPDPSVKTPKRGTTITPLQALSLMNSSFVQRQAGYLAERVRQEAKNDDGKGLTLAYRYCFGRGPTAQERHQAEATLQETDWPTVCWALLNATEFLYVK